MNKNELKSVHKELLLESNKKKTNKIHPIILVTPAILLALCVILFSKDIWKPVAARVGTTIPAHTIMYMVALFAGTYLLTHIAVILNIMRFLLENRIGFGLKGRLAKTPSSNEVSCIILLIRGSLLVCLYLVVIGFARKYLG